MKEPSRGPDPESLGDLLHAVTVRSTIAAGRVRSIRLGDGIDWDAVIRVDATDLPDRATVERVFGDQPLLVRDRVCHEAEPILLVAAPTRDAAERAAAAIQIDYELSEPVPSIEKALAAYVTLHGSDNVYERHEFRRGNIMRGFAEADVVREDKLRITAVEPLVLAPRRVVAVPTANGGLTLHGAWAAPDRIHQALRELLGLDDERLRVMVDERARTAVEGLPRGWAPGCDCGHGAVIAAHAALLARRSGRPVMLHQATMADMRAMGRRHPAIVRHRSGLRSDGTLVARDILVFLDGGAYGTSSRDVLVRAMVHATGPYRCPNVRVRGRVLATHRAPRGTLVGDGVPQVTCGCELHLDRAARQLGIDRLAIRRRNGLRGGDRLATGQALPAACGEVLGPLLDALPAEAPAAVGPSDGGATVLPGVGIAAGMVAVDLPEEPGEVAEALLSGERPLTYLFGMQRIDVTVDPGDGAVEVRRACAVATLGDGGEPRVCRERFASGLRCSLEFGYHREFDTAATLPATNCALGVPESRAVDVGLVPSGQPAIDPTVAAELAMAATTPALIAAVSEALGRDFDSVPISSARVVNAVQGGARPWRAVSPRDGGRNP
jgi:CO/xanthine dehydrogenase Mo-binding subunit